MRSCIRCGAPGAAFANRCKACALADRAPAAERRAVAERHNAAAKLRAAVNKLGYATCRACDLRFSAAKIEIDHTIPLARGGTDTESNVRPLCRGCHRAKTEHEQSLVQ